MAKCGKFQKLRCMPLLCWNKCVSSLVCGEGASDRAISGEETEAGEVTEANTVLEIDVEVDSQRPSGVTSALCNKKC